MRLESGVLEVKLEESSRKRQHLRKNNKGQSGKFLAVEKRRTSNEIGVGKSWNMEHWKPCNFGNLES